MATIDPEREGEIQALLRESVKAQHADPLRAARVRAAVHAEWRAQQPRRQVDWTWWAAGAAAAAVLAAVLVSRSPERPDPALTSSVPAPLATVRYVAGSVAGRLSATSEAGPVRTGDVLAAGAELVTGGEAAGPGLGATVALADGVEVRVGGLTRLVVSGPRRLELRFGTIYVDTGTRLDRSAPEPIEIASAGSLIRDIGTRFLVRGGTAVAVVVRDGRVQLDQGGVRYEAGGGEALSVTPNGRVTREPAVLFGPAWDWIVRAAPAPEVDGRTLSEFLAWAEREGGRAIRFADASVGQAAASTLVYGAIDGLSVDEALAVVLPSCGLAHRVDGAVITIVASDDSRTR